jgi:late competence protein required for DNA uptake (superfamily II DNA/RNA helicase)
MLRDMDDFVPFLQMSNMTGRFHYRLGLNFTYTDKDVLVIDESDALTFADPLAFKLMMAGCRCICLTASPDDNNKKGAEKQVVAALNLTRFEYGYPQELTVPAVVNETKLFEDNDAVLCFI